MRQNIAELPQNSSNRTLEKTQYNKINQVQVPVLGQLKHSTQALPADLFRVPRLAGDPLDSVPRSHCWVQEF